MRSEKDMKRKVCKRLAHFLLLIPLGCFDYQEAYVAQTSTANYYPYIDKDFVLPQPSTTDAIFFGQDCKKQFTVPPIKDFNHDDKLHFLWFFDGDLLSGPRVIEPENRSDALIVLSLDRALLESHLGRSLDDAFFSKRHILQFFVADRPYKIPESRYLVDGALQDSVYWSLSFSNVKC